MFHLGRGGPESYEAAAKHLADLKPGERQYLWVEGHPDHTLVVVATIYAAFHSDRRRYLVGCCTCSALLNEATTGPLENVSVHVRGNLP